MPSTADLLPRLVTTRRFGDDRGWFAETYNARSLAEQGIDTVFVQDNQSFSAARGTLRGLHFQTPPHGQAKLVRCLRGAIFDVAVDVRAGSPSYGKWDGVELTAESGNQLFIPIGFAHGFVTLTDDCEIAYKVSDYYAPQSDGGIAWNDPQIGLDWPLAGRDPVLSDKDRSLPLLAGFDSPFAYDGHQFSGIER